MCKMIAVLLLLLIVVPGTSCAGLSNGVQSNPGVSAITMTKETGQGGTAGIHPVSSEEFSGKINKTISEIYKTASPIIDGVAVIMLAVTGVAAPFMLFSGASLLSRVLGSVFGIGIGLLLYYKAPYVIGLVKRLIQ